jgi:hypothetical protein
MSDARPIPPELDLGPGSAFAAFCPACWSEVSSSDSSCPDCGKAFAALAAEQYEAKLRRSLRHPIGEVRERAATLLGEVAGPEVRPLLFDLVLQEADIYLAAAALRGLARLQKRHPSLPPIDWKAFTSPEYPLLVRVAALEVLRSRGVK